MWIKKSFLVKSKINLAQFFLTSRKTGHQFLLLFWLVILSFLAIFNPFIKSVIFEPFWLIFGKFSVISRLVFQRNLPLAELPWWLFLMLWELLYGHQTWIVWITLSEQHSFAKNYSKLMLFTGKIQKPFKIFCVSLRFQPTWFQMYVWYTTMVCL